VEAGEEEDHPEGLEVVDLVIKALEDQEADLILAIIAVKVVILQEIVVNHREEIQEME